MHSPWKFKVGEEKKLNSSVRLRAKHVSYINPFDVNTPTHAPEMKMLANRPRDNRTICNRDVSYLQIPFCRFLEDMVQKLRLNCISVKFQGAAKSHGANDELFTQQSQIPNFSNVCDMFDVARLVHRNSDG